MDEKEVVEDVRLRQEKHYFYRLYGYRQIHCWCIAGQTYGLDMGGYGSED